MKDDEPRLTPGEEEELIGAVLRRTTGGACRRAEALLAEHPDWSPAIGPATPGPADTDLALLDSHLEHCAACRELARHLALARETLPSLASFDPGPSFTTAVLAATSRAEPASFADRLAGRWAAWLARPRFALEAAYVATLVLLIVAGNPAARLQAASERTTMMAVSGLDRAREAWPAAIARVAPAAAELPERVRRLGNAASATVRGTAGGASLGGAWDRALAEWSVAWGWLQGAAWDVVTSVAGTFAGVRDAVSRWMQPRTEPAPPSAR